MFRLPPLSPRVRQYATLFLGIMVMALSGSLFSFASFSTDLKARFGFTSSNINLLSSIGDTSMYVGFLIVGPIYDHYGERWTMITASILTFLGYGGMYVVYAKAWGGLVPMMILYCFAGVASTAGYLAALAVNMANFPVSQSGTVSGVLLAFFGLSATLFSQIKTHLFSGDDAASSSFATQQFLLFLAIITTAIYLVGTVFMVRTKTIEVKQVESARSSISSASSAPTLAGIEPADNPLSRTTTLNSDRYADWGFSTSTLDKEAAEAAAAAAAHAQPHLPGDSILDTTAPGAPVAPAAIAVSPPSETWFNPYLVSEDMKPKQLLVEASFWLFVIAQVSQQGFSYINNVDSIVHALLDPFDPSTAERAVQLTGLHVTLISIGNCLGRLASGVISDYVIHHYKVSRSIFFLGSQILILPPLIIMGFSSGLVNLTELIVCSCLIGATYGATGALFASMTRDFFGDTYYGTNCGMVMVLNGFNPIIANQIYGVFYDQALKAMPDQDVLGTSICVGSDCYSKSFEIATGMQVLCVAAAAGLFWARVRKGKKVMAARAVLGQATA